MPKTKTVIENVQVDGVDIRFYPNSHQYKREVDGKWKNIISPTGVLKIMNKPALLFWAVNCMKDLLEEKWEANKSYTANEIAIILEEGRRAHTAKKDEAASIGHEIHKFAEDWIKDKNTEIPEDNMKVVKGITSFLKFMTEHKAEFTASEKIVYSKTHDFVGTCDGIAKIDGKTVLIDFKTGKGIYFESFLQVSAYQLALEDMGEKIDYSMILHFDKETGEFIVHKIENDKYKKYSEVFLSCLNISKMKKELDVAL